MLSAVNQQSMKLMNEQLFVYRNSITFLIDYENYWYHRYTGMSKRRRIKPIDEARRFFEPYLYPLVLDVDRFGEKGKFTIKYYLSMQIRRTYTFKINIKLK